MLLAVLLLLTCILLIVNIHLSLVQLGRSGIPGIGPYIDQLVLQADRLQLGDNPAFSDHKRKLAGLNAEHYEHFGSSYELNTQKYETMFETQHGASPNMAASPATQTAIEYEFENPAVPRYNLAGMKTRRHHQHHRAEPETVHD